LFSRKRLWRREVHPGKAAMIDKVISILAGLVSLLLLLAVFIMLARPTGKPVAPQDSAGCPQVEKEKITLAGVAVLFCSFWAAVYLAYKAGAYLFLAYLYGFIRVLGEGLHFVAMPKGRPWVVSNGDLIAEEHFVHFLFTLPLMVGLYFVFYAVAVQISPWPLFKGGGRTKRGT
jgi:hypothetical protein